MALNITGLTRTFKHGNIELDDPNPQASPEWVLNFYSATYSELTTATIDGPNIKDGQAEYVFTKTVGVKG